MAQDIDVVANFRREIDRMFTTYQTALAQLGAPFSSLSSVFGRQLPQGESGERTIMPLTDIVEGENAYWIMMEIPGIDPKNVEVNISGQSLLVRATKQEDRGPDEGQQQSGRTYLLSERTVGTIQRQFRIPDDVDTNQITADFRHGLLALTLKRSQQAQRRKIAIKTN